MKYSGIEWIESLPEAWQEIPNRYLFIDHSVKVGESWKDYQLLSLTTSGVKEKDVNAGGGRVIIESIFQMFMNDKEIKKYKRYAQDSTLEMFEKSLFPDKFQEMATQCCMDNSDSYRKLFTDTEFYQQVMKAMARELYKVLRKA